METNEKYIEFRQIGAKPRTKVYGVFSLRHGTLLGRVFWYGPWRSYVFAAEPDTVWSAGCLDTVSSFLRDLRGHRGRDQGCNTDVSQPSSVRSVFSPVCVRRTGRVVKG